MEAVEERKRDVVVRDLADDFMEESAIPDDPSPTLAALKIEKTKQELALHSDFNLLSAFRLFDYSGRGFVTPRDIQLKLQSLGMIYSLTELARFIEAYSQNGDSSMMVFHEFCDAMSPQSEKYLRLLIERDEREKFSLDVRVMREGF